MKNARMRRFIQEIYENIRPEMKEQIFQKSETSGLPVQTKQADGKNSGGHL